MKDPSARGRASTSTTPCLARCCTATTTKPSRSTWDRSSRWPSGNYCAATRRNFAAFISAECRERLEASEISVGDRRTHTCASSRCARARQAACDEGWLFERGLRLRQRRFCRKPSTFWKTWLPLISRKLFVVKRFCNLKAMTAVYFLHGNKCTKGVKYSKYNHLWCAFTRTDCSLTGFSCKHYFFCSVLPPQMRKQIYRRYHLFSCFPSISVLLRRTYVEQTMHQDIRWVFWTRKEKRNGPLLDLNAKLMYLSIKKMLPGRLSDDSGTFLPHDFSSERF